MLIAHISDLHIAAPGKKAYGVVPTAENLARCVDHINQLQPAVDLVLITGDITANALPEEALRSAELLAYLKMPFYIVPGNHDESEQLWSIFGKNGCPAMESGHFNYVIDGYPLHFIALDSTVPGEPGGGICADQAVWLDEQLAAAKGKPTLIFMHHPPVKCGVLETDEDGFVGADLLGDVVEKYNNIERILCGHIHLNTHIRWSRTVITIAPSMGLQLLLDLTMKLPSSFVEDTPAYLLHYWSPDRQLISHAVSLHQTQDSHRF